MRPHLFSFTHDLLPPRNQNPMSTIRHFPLSRPILLLLAVFLGPALACYAQTNPVAQSLPFNLVAQSGSTLPAGVAAHKYTAIPITRTTAPADADVAYNSGSNSGGWRDESANGIGILPSSTNPAAAVVV